MQRFHPPGREPEALDGERIDHFVREDDSFERLVRKRVQPFHPERAEALPLAVSEVGARLEDPVPARGGATARELREAALGERSGPASELEDLAPAEAVQDLLELPGQATPEERGDLGSGDEVPLRPELRATRRVVSEPGSVETELHVLGEWNRALILDPPADEVLCPPAVRDRLRSGGGELRWAEGVVHRAARHPARAAPRWLSPSRWRSSPAPGVAWAPGSPASCTRPACRWRFTAIVPERRPSVSARRSRPPDRGPRRWWPRTSSTRSRRPPRPSCGRRREPWGRLDVLVNNASTFYPTPVGEVTEADWGDLVGSNLAAPFFLAQTAAPLLRAARGCILNIADVYGHRPLAGHAVYSAAKAGLVMLTRALALELGPEVRVNSISPGAVLWPENEDPERGRIIDRIALGRSGDPGDIARAALFLVRDAPYVTGQDLAVDGGRLLSV